MIMWENLGYNKQSRVLRIMCTTITACILLATTLTIVLFVRSFDSGLNNFSPEINCEESTTEVDKEVAFRDQLKPLNDREGFMHCYCRQLLYEAIESKSDIYSAMDFKFENGEKYCEQWLPKYILDNIMIILVPFIIIVINFISKRILMRMTRFEKR